MDRTNEVIDRRVEEMYRINEVMDRTNEVTDRRIKEMDSHRGDG